MDRQEQLRNEKVGILLLKFSIPAIIGMIVNALYNIADRIFVGKGVDELALTGIGIVFPFMTILMAFAMLVGIGGASLISIRLGQNKIEDAEKILGNSFVLMIIITSIITIFGLIFRDSLLMIFGASEDTFKYAKDYITIILYGALANTIGFGMNHMIRSQGHPKAAMATMLMGAIINTILDPVFIFIFNMGIKGAAYATVFAQTVSAIYVLLFLQSKNSTLNFHIKNMKLSKDIILGIFSIGMSPFSMQLAASVVNTISNNALKNYGGDLAIGAMSVIFSVAMMFLMPIFGINQGSQPIIGYNYGAKQYDRVKKAYKLAVGAATMFSTLGFIIIELFPETVIRIFNDSPDLINIGSNGIRIYLAMLPIIGFQIVSSNYFQAIGKAKISIFLSLLRQVILLIPLLLILPPIFKLTGVWLSAPTSDALSALITGVFIWREMKKLDKEYKLSLETL
ncbi:MATE family efflux transporter [Defluviitalea phaphyphila]|uniref:MATE family efflux transporter n=1 Tax=Defluviitalea phaphyphila TaxID=1473580 RepID=UPI000730A216|nr:MATE family efflux transporter [Defluviitalea phaphyphila]